ncbi:hypothetical protein PENTCL1PPCAC_25902 [Pristionchus entomophagus]|uniref:Acyl-CoA thioesterase-like C-terminal domain-containing protein n=1 Tax=Pristionchus entomophagus TaxID=358040 RepID=A0AAV5UBJ6_9BILA|nr:hypothetical protein PENTCL1PPCAC_25902 [Pristionchus entomophagus]
MRTSLSRVCVLCSFISNRMGLSCTLIDEVFSYHSLVLCVNHQFPAMFTAPTTISNYFNMVPIDKSNVRSDPPYIGGAFGIFIIPDRTFGGLSVSQAVNSFITLNPGLTPHTINYKFVAPAKTSIPLQFKLSHFDDGKMASIFAYQNEKPVGMGHIRYTKDSDHLDSSSFLCPDHIGSPHRYPRAEELVPTMEGHRKVVMTELGKFPLEYRPVESPLDLSNERDRMSIWLRIKPHHQDDLKPNDGLLVLLFISDFSILQAGSEIYQKSKVQISSGASLHHSVWIHDTNLDPLAWYLTVVECEVISFGRVRLESYIFNESRKCVMTVVQEGYMQRAKEEMNKL